jgi:hypothetical protein
MEERRTVGKMNGTAITNRLQNSFKITCTDHRIIEILGLRPSNRLPVSYYLNHVASCDEFSYYYQFSDIAINSVNRSFI